MSRAMRPTRDQKVVMDRTGLIWRNWLVVKETETLLKVVSKSGGRTRTIKKDVQTVRAIRTSR